jgi:predicted  nucleic acid-binding Zn-ribbon protein
MTEEENKEFQEELEKLRQEKAALNGELVTRDTRLNEIQQALTAKDGELVVLRQNVAELKTQIGSMSENLGRAVTGYQKLAIKANPEIPSELIIGETVEAIENAVASACKLVGKVKDKLAAAQTQARVPAGAPQRTPPDLSVLSPREKIQYAIGGKH